MKEEDIKKIAGEVLRLKREEVFEQPPSKAAMSNEDLLKKLTASLIEHRSPCHDLSKDDIHCLKKVIKSKVQFAKTKGIVKAGLALFLLKELFLYIKEHLHWGQ